MALLKGSTDLMIPTICNLAIKGNRYHQQGVWWKAFVDDDGYFVVYHIGKIDVLASSGY